MKVKEMEELAEMHKLECVAVGNTFKTNKGREKQIDFAWTRNCNVVPGSVHITTPLGKLGGEGHFDHKAIEFKI